jgi:putative PIG3 family NAD(P)H quinone oxidoreductase
MKAVLCTSAAGPDGLTFGDVSEPAPGPDEVLVGVRATALNRADLLQTLGRYPAPAGAPRDIPGLEYAGEVLAVGPRVTRWRPGDRVMGLVAGGAWAERLVVHEREAIAVPSTLSLAEAAALPEAFATAWDALVAQGGCSAGTRVLIHAVASGVGTAALQLCRLLGAQAVGTSRTEAKLRRARDLGLADVVLVRDAGFASEVRRLTGGRGADLALDLVGGAWLPETIEAMAPRGTVMLVGVVAGAKAEISLGAVLGKRLRLIGTTLRARALEEKIAVARAFEERLVPSFERGLLSPVIDATLPMLEIRAALARLAQNDTFGKLVLTW